MALIAHWPLNGNTDDISGNGYTLTNNNVTFVNGKIGQAADFNGIASYLYRDSETALTAGSLTISAWLRLEEAGNWMIMQRGALGANGAYYLYGDNNLQVKWSIFGPTGTRYDNIFSFTLTSGVWNHITAVYNSLTNQSKLYINGVLVNTVTAVLGNGAYPIYVGTYSAGSYWLDGQLNDLRFYNEALTDMEVQEIARAKILHYTFDDMQEPTTNITTGIISNYGGSTSYSNGTSLFQVTRTLDSITEGPYRYSRYVGTINSDNNQVIWYMNYRGTADFYKTFTVSAYMRGTGTCHFALYDDGTGYKIGPNFTLTNEWTKYTYTGTFGGTYTAYHWVALRGVLDTTTVDISSLQIEEKPYATEFTEGTRQGIIRDHSGFFLDAALGSATTPQWVTDSKLGIGAYRFNGTNTSIQTATIPGVETFTVSIWFKPHITSAVNRIYWGTGSNRIILNQSGSNMKWYVQTLTGAVGYVTTSLTYNVNNWNHAVLRYNGSIVEFFLNGVKDTVTGSVTGYSGAGSINLGTTYNKADYFFDGELDDFRFYATPLLDSDITDLYQTRAEIEEGGVLYARDFLSNAEETVNLANTKIFGPNVDINGVPSGKYASNSSSYGFTISSVNSIESTGKSITASIYLRSQTDPASTYLFYVFTGTGPDGGWWNFGSGTLTKDWKRIVTTRSDINGPISSIRLYRQNSLGTMDYADLQLEMNDHVTPFVSTYRPASQLPSTLEFGADEVHETGTANFEDFSTVGITDGLVGYWQLDDNAKDCSGNNYNGTISGAISYGEFYKFNGVDDFIDIPFQVLTTQQIRNSGLTIIARVRPTTTKDARIFSMKPSTGYWDSATGGIGITGSGYAQMIAYDDNIAYKYVSSSTILTVNNWYLIAGLYNPTDSTMRLYINGVQEGTPQVITTYSRLVSNDETFIGKDSTGTRTFAGDIDYVKVFNRALTAEEIAIEYNTMANNQIQIHESGTVYAKDIVQY